MANSCCGGSVEQNQGDTFTHCAPLGARLVEVEVPKNLQEVDPCVTLVAYKAEVVRGPLQKCKQEQSCKWCKWLPWALLGLLVLALLLWAPWRGGGWSSASATAGQAPTHQLAQAGQPVSVTANPVNYTEINLNGAQLASAGVKPSMKPVKPAVPTKPCKAVVFDPNGTMRAYGVDLAVDGANYTIRQTSGELASPNDIAAAQAARPNGWVTVVLDPSGPYAVTSKGGNVQVMMDNQGRILVPVSQVQI